MKTGTTTVGIKCKDAIILAADKRATAGTFVVNKDIDKVMPINDRMALTVAGTVSDIQLLAKLLKAELKLKEIRSNRKNTVKEAANLLAGMVYGNIRQFSTIPGISHFLFGGYDGNCSLYDIYPDGSISDISNFVSTGSGSMFAYGVLEAQYKENMTEEQGVQLALKAINSALQRDSASGNGIDVISITKDGVKKVEQKIINTGIY
ncbi:MAG: proteasome subunit beta [Candidatus Woesearchaeota archaeon]